MSRKNTFLEKENTDCIKGICAIAILIAHLYSRTGIGSTIGLGPILTSFGYLGVSVFFALSGYGLAYSYENKKGIIRFRENNILNTKGNGEGYLSNFLRNRVLSTYFLQAFCVLLYGLSHLLFLGPVSLKAFVQSFFLFDTVVTNGWYLQTIIVFYLIFYCSYQWLHRYQYVGVGLGLMFFVLICVAYGVSKTWYECSFCFLLGFILYYMRFELQGVINKNTLFITTYLVVSFLFIAMFVLGNGQYIKPLMVRVPIKMMSSVLFAFLVLFVSNRVSVKNRLTKWLSYYYLEIYLFQGIVFMALRNRFWNLSNPYIFLIIALILTLLVAHMIKPLTSRILAIVKCKLV